MRKIIIILILSLLINFDIGLVAAEEGEYEYEPHDKFSRGAFNMLTFFFEVPITIYETSKNGNPIIGLFYGLPVGIGKGFTRAIVGLVEFTTFPFPPYEPLVEPEFLLSD